MQKIRKILWPVFEKNEHHPTTHPTNILRPSSTGVENCSAAEAAVSTPGWTHGISWHLWTPLDTWTSKPYWTPEHLNLLAPGALNKWNCNLWTHIHLSTKTLKSPTYSPEPLFNPIWSNNKPSVNSLTPNEPLKLRNSEPLIALSNFQVWAVTTLY